MRDSYSDIPKNGQHLRTTMKNREIKQNPIPNLKSKSLRLKSPSVKLMDDYYMYVHIYLYISLLMFFFFLIKKNKGKIIKCLLSINVPQLWKILGSELNILT